MNFLLVHPCRRIQRQSPVLVLVSGVGGRRRCWYRAQPRPVLFVVVVVVVVDELSLIVAGPGTRNTVQLGLFRPRGVVAYTNAESGVRKLLEA